MRLTAPIAVIWAVGRTVFLQPLPCVDGHHDERWDLMLGVKPRQGVGEPHGLHVLAIVEKQDGEAPSAAGVVVWWQVNINTEAGCEVFRREIAQPMQV